MIRVPQGDSDLGPIRRRQESFGGFESTKMFAGNLQIIGRKLQVLKP